ncbi:MAG: hypothetical protein MJ137_06275 [Clostridia bacterium]|nr:hypothetical protein [Clostridia bacterium]
MKKDNKNEKQNITGAEKKRDGGKIPAILSESSDGLAQMLIRALSNPATLVLIPVLIVFAAIGRWAEALASAVAYTVLTVALTYLGAVADRIYKSISRDFSDGNGSDVKGCLPKFTDMYLRICRVGTVVLLLLSAVVLVSMLISGSRSFGDNLSVFLTSVIITSVICGPQNRAVPAFIGAVRAYKLAYKSKSAPVAFLSESAVAVLADAGSAVIDDEDVIYDKRIEVRGVWFADEVYSGITLKSSALRTPAEKALLIGAAYGNNCSSYPAYIMRISDALAEFSDVMIPDPSILLSDISDIHTLDNHPLNDCVTLRITGMSDLSGTSVITGCPGDSFSKCNAYRNSDGRVVPLTDSVKKSIGSFFKKTSDYCLSPFFIYSTVNTHGRVSGDTILEAAFAVGGDFTEASADADVALNDFGISTGLWLPRADRYSVSFAVGSGFVTDRTSVFIGGRDSEDSLKERSTKPRVFLAVQEPALVSGKDSVFVGNSALAPDESSVRISGGEEKPSGKALAVIPHSDTRRQNGGLASLFELISSAAEIGFKQFTALFVMCSFSVALFVSYIVPVIFGIQGSVPGPFAVLLSGIIITALIVFVLSADNPMLCHSVMGLSRLSVPGGFSFAAVSGFVSGLAVFGGSLISDGLSPAYFLSAYVFSGTVMLAAARINADVHFGYTGFGIHTAVAAALCCGTAVLMSFVMPAAFGSAASGPRSVILSLVVSLIPAAVSFGAVFGTAWLFFPKLISAIRRVRRQK